MADNKNNFYSEEESGLVRISDEVIASIATVAARETEGVHSISAGVAGDFAAGIFGKKVAIQSAKVSVDDDQVVDIEVALIVRYGYVIPTVAKKAQKNIAEAVESMTGLKIGKIKVQVVGINFDENPPPAAPKPEKTEQKKDPEPSVKAPEAPVQEKKPEPAEKPQEAPAPKVQEKPAPEHPKNENNPFERPAQQDRSFQPPQQNRNFQPPQQNENRNAQPPQQNQNNFRRPDAPPSAPVQQRPEQGNQNTSTKESIRERMRKPDSPFSSVQPIDDKKDSE